MRPRALGLVVLGGVVLAIAPAVAGWVADHHRARPAPRPVVIVIHHSRFEPPSLTVTPGSTVRFVIRNTDPIDHEFILGDAATQRRHELGSDASHDGSVPGEVSLPAGQERATTYTFPGVQGAATGGLEYACHLPGHYAYGMHGQVVLAVGRAARQAGAPPAGAAMR